MKKLFIPIIAILLFGGFAVTDQGKLLAQADVEDPEFGGGGRCVWKLSNDATCRGESVVPRCGFRAESTQEKNCHYSSSF